MVSFCCDQCQEVVKKPKIEKHFLTCRTRSVSCVDCGKTFDRVSVTSHISCITEKEKYEKQPVSKELSSQCLEGDTNLYCKTCVTFNSALQGEQHYQSKRHISAAKRRLANENKSTSLNNGAAQMESNTQVTMDKANGQAKSNGADSRQTSVTSKEKSNDKKETKKVIQKHMSLKRAIKKLVVSKGVGLSWLLRKLEKQGFSSENLEKKVLRRVKKSRKLFMDGERIKLKK